MEKFVVHLVFEFECFITKYDLLLQQKVMIQSLYS